MGEFAPEEVDYELVSHEQQFGSHINTIPIQSAVQGPRLFYGARFDNQAMPVKNREAPLVQNLDTTDPEQRSFDQQLGHHMGAVFSDEDGVITDVTPDYVKYKTPTGEIRRKDLYNTFVLNRKSSINSTAKVKKGDSVKKGQILASSNFTDDEGTMALGMNAKIALLPYKGYSMDDAMVISQSFADKLVSEHTETHEKEFDRDVRPGLNHFKSLFPEKFKKDQLAKMDATGTVMPGQILNEGDPIILATKPKVISSTGINVGKLTKTMSQSRQDGSTMWESKYPAEVVDVFHTPKGVKVVTRAYATTQPADKLALRSGGKGVVSLILPDERMPRTKDDEPVDILLNPLSIPSRTNSSLLYEIMLGKVAKKTGKPVKIPGFTKPGEKWYEKVLGMLEENQLSDKETLFDPETGKDIENPVLVGNAYILKLHHTGESKLSYRGQGSYDGWQQPTKGPGEGGKSKRLSGLESSVMLSSGAYNNLREVSTLRGSSNDEFWRALRTGMTTPNVGVPFAWNKTMHMMIGAGITPRPAGKGILRLSPTTDDDVDNKKAVEIKKGELLNLHNMSPVAGGLFDPSIVGNNGWGKITLPFRVPNPAYEDAVRILLGLKKQDLQDILAGKKHYPPH